MVAAILVMWPNPTPPPTPEQTFIPLPLEAPYEIWPGGFWTEDVWSVWTTEPAYTISSTMSLKAQVS